MRGRLASLGGTSRRGPVAAPALASNTHTHFLTLTSLTTGRTAMPRVPPSPPPSRRRLGERRGLAALGSRAMSPCDVPVRAVLKLSLRLLCKIGVTVALVLLAQHRGGGTPYDCARKPHSTAPPPRRGATRDQGEPREERGYRRRSTEMVAFQD